MSLQRSLRHTTRELRSLQRLLSDGEEPTEAVDIVRRHIFTETTSFVDASNFLELLLRERWSHIAEGEGAPVDTATGQQRFLLLHALELLRSNSQQCLARVKWANKMLALEMELLHKYCTLAGTEADHTSARLLLHCSDFVKDHPWCTALAIAGIGALVATVYHMVHNYHGRKALCETSEAQAAKGPAVESSSLLDSLHVMGPLAVPHPAMLLKAPPPSSVLPPEGAAAQVPRISSLGLSAIATGLATSLSLGALVSGVSRAGARHRLSLDTRFMSQFRDLQARLRSGDEMMELGHLVTSLRGCHAYNQQYNAFLESIADRECAVCLGVLGPCDDRVRSDEDECGSFHVFHRHCLPKHVRKKGCPICCRQITDLQCASMESPFQLGQHT